MKTISRLYTHAALELKDVYDERETRSLCAILCRELFGYTKVDIHVRKEEPLEEEGVNNFSRMIAELKRGRPVQYVTGGAEFAGRRFLVDEYTLIPRPETEELAAWVRESGGLVAGDRLLDVGTGSGCIAIALAGWLPGVEVQGVDISGGALRVARENARLNGVVVEFLERDITRHGEWGWPGYHVIVSNPPYVRLSEGAMMEERVVMHEPHVALFVPDDDPLLFYRVIAEFGRQYLVPGGKLFFEINERAGAGVVALLSTAGYERVELREDLFGKDRLVRCERGERPWM